MNLTRFQTYNNLQARWRKHPPSFRSLATSLAGITNLFTQTARQCLWAQERSLALIRQLSIQLESRLVLIISSWTLVRTDRKTTLRRSLGRARPTLTPVYPRRRPTANNNSSSRSSSNSKALVSLLPKKWSISAMRGLHFPADKPIRKNNSNQICYFKVGNSHSTCQVFIIMLKKCRRLI